jgi:diaminopimelate decarboxylase
MPYLGKATSEAYVDSRGQYQALYNPLSTHGQETIWVSSIAGLSWSYKGYGITVHNKSDTSKDMMRLEHDIDESKRFEYPIVIEPGRVAYVHSGHYSGEDAYGILFCERTSTFGSEQEWFEVKCNVSLERGG